MRADEYLRQPKKIDAEIEKLRGKRQSLWAAATGTTQANDGMPHATGTTDKVGNAAQKIADLDREINKRVDKYVDARNDVIKHIKMLPKRQYEVLSLMYIEKRETIKPGQGWYFSWREIAAKMGCTEQNVAKLKRKAVKNLQKIIDSC